MVQPDLSFGDLLMLAAKNDHTSNKLSDKERKCLGAVYQ